MRPRDDVRHLDDVVVTYNNIGCMNFFMRL